MSFPCIISLKIPTILMKQNHVLLFSNITYERIICVFFYLGELYFMAYYPPNKRIIMQQGQLKLNNCYLDFCLFFVFQDKRSLDGSNCSGTCSVYQTGQISACVCLLNTRTNDMCHQKHVPLHPAVLSYFTYPNLRSLLTWMVNIPIV